MYALIKILFNTKLNRWHPIFYKMSPMPGSSTTVVRFKSFGHHTKGLVTKEEALANVYDSEFVENLKTHVGIPLYDILQEMIWDGEEMPADVLIMSEDQFNGLKDSLKLAS